MPEQIDPRAFRDACGQFATGVTVVTTLGADGRPVGLTVNSFASVSLEPPMVLFCLGNTSETLPAFDAGNGFVVHVLSEAQRFLSMKFAAKGTDRFEGILWDPGVNGNPVIPGALSTFECELAHRYQGGDHTIYVGLVANLTTGDYEAGALGYFRGSYLTVE